MKPGKAREPDKVHLSSGGYRATYVPEHRRANHNGDVLEHILIAERALGKPFPTNAETHHYGAKTDNTKLVICEDHAYHTLLHIRTEAYRVTGNAHARKCRVCG